MIRGPGFDEKLPNPVVDRRVSQSHFQYVLLTGANTQSHSYEFPALHDLVRAKQTVDGMTTNECNVLVFGLEQGASLNYQIG